MKHIIDQEGLGGNPTYFYQAGGLENFEYLTELIYSLSPYDSLKLPTASFYPNMAGTSDFSEIDFVELLAIKTNYIRNNILEERHRQERRLRR